MDEAEDLKTTRKPQVDAGKTVKGIVNTARSKHVATPYTIYATSAGNSLNQNAWVGA